MLVAVAGCSGGGSSGSATTTTQTSIVSPTGGGGAAGATSTTVQASGDRTVLSPIGLNVRSGPSTSASVLGSAAEGTTLTVRGHTDQGGGWYQVKGATVSSGYITDNPSLSAPGDFQSYSDGSGAFSALYPMTWMSKMLPPAGVVFLPPSGHDSIIITTAATAKQLGQAQAGYHTTGSKSTVVCGVTGQLTTYMQVTGTTQTAPSLPAGSVAEQYLVQIDLTLDPMHALGVEAFLADISQLPTVENVMNSLSFPFPACEGGASSAASTTSTSR